MIPELSKPATAKELASLWNSFESLEYLSDGDIKELIVISEAAIKYCDSRGKKFYLAARAIRDDLNTLREYANARELKY